MIENICYIVFPIILVVITYITNQQESERRYKIFLTFRGAQNDEVEMKFSKLLPAVRLYSRITLSWWKIQTDRIRLIGGAEARAVEAVGRLIFMRNSSAWQMFLLLTEPKQSKWEWKPLPMPSMEMLRSCLLFSRLCHRWLQRIGLLFLIFILPFPDCCRSKCSTIQNWRDCPDWWIWQCWPGSQQAAWNFATSCASSYWGWHIRGKIL